MCLGHVDAAWEETARIAIRAGVFVHAGEPLPRLGGRHFQKPRTREHEGGPQRIEGKTVEFTSSPANFLLDTQSQHV